MGVVRVSILYNQIKTLYFANVTAKLYLKEKKENKLRRGNFCLNMLFFEIELALFVSVQENQFHFI